MEGLVAVVELELDEPELAGVTADLSELLELLDELSELLDELESLLPEVEPDELLSDDVDVDDVDELDLPPRESVL